MATLDISKSLTVIKYVGGITLVNSGKMGELATLIEGVEELTFTGITSQSKAKKYQSIIESLGYEVTSTEWSRNAGFEGKNSDVIDFCVNYKNRADQ